jgi:DNA topoisomerase-2
MSAKKAARKVDASVEVEEEYDVEYKTYDDERKHVIDRPDMYGGSKTDMRTVMRVLTDRGVENEAVTYTPIAKRLFHEGMDNAADACTTARERGLGIGRYEVVLSPRRISILNESAYIPIAKQLTKDDDGVVRDKGWKPYICFGKLKTSSNYDDSKKRVVVGKNGVGGHLLPIQATLFTLDVTDPAKKLKYRQIWRDNASKVDDPTIVPWSTFTVGHNGKPCGSVRVDWVLSSVSSASGIDYYSPSLLRHFKRCLADLSFASDIPVHVIEYARGDEEGFSGAREESVYDLRGESYFQLYPKLNGAKRCSVEYEGSRVYLFDAPASGFTESIVNSAGTPKGGVHVNVWRQRLYRMLHKVTVARYGKLIGEMEGKTKGTKRKEMTDKGLEKLYGPHTTLILSCLLNQPAYDSQAKYELTGPTPELPADIKATEKLIKHTHNDGFEGWALFSEVEAALQAKMKRKAVKEGGKKVEFVDVPDAEDAQWAGTKNSDKCALIICEGKSGKTIAIKGAQMMNPKAYGVLPFRGKVANLFQHPDKSAQVVDNLKRLLGWAPGKRRKDLRYNRLLIMTDADPDGIHIRLLTILMIYVAFPGLLEEGFVEAFVYPIVLVERRGTTLAFYTLSQYEEWASANNGGRGWHPKYFKGLGSCNDKDIRYAFTHPLVVRYECDELAQDALRLAFEKGQEDERKRWLVEYDPKETFVYPSTLKVSTSVLKELPIFSMYENERAISNIMDGLNLGQRKVIHVIRKYGIDSEHKIIKVKQLAGKVAEDTAYHHNEDVLQDTITRLNYTVAGKNNMPLLMRSGEFGSRLLNGQDAANGRYTHTYGSPVLKTVFTAEDDSILQYNLDGTKPVEPTFFYGVIAVVLANSQEGIGCGSNSKIPCYNPVELISRHKDHCARVRSERLGEPLVAQPFPVLLPWARNYRGTITYENGEVIDRGVFTQRGGTIYVTEIPLRMSYQDYYEHLNTMKNTFLGETREEKAARGPKRRVTKAEKVKAVRDAKKGLKTPKAKATAKASKSKGKEHAVEDAETVVDGTEVEGAEDVAADGEEGADEEEAGKRGKAGGKKGKARLLKFHRHEAYLLREDGADVCLFELREFAMVPTHKNLKLETKISITQLTVFDEKGKLRHFPTAEALLEYYSGVMVASRGRLLQKLIEEGEARVAELELKVRFVAEVVEQPTLVAGRKEPALSEWMGERGYPKAFLEIPLRSITDAMVTKVGRQLEAERETLAYYRGTAPEELWLAQLERFEESYYKLYPAA